MLDIHIRHRLTKAMPGLKERAKTLVDLVKASEFLFSDGPRVLDDDARKLLQDEAGTVVARVIPALEKTDWSAPALEQAV